ncbi:MAG TPA: glycogen/starch synthase [Candidatus Kapabacteria bacterium]|jgi:starch synthase|nr:glycogen/starch synthase [Candidatus Kapabacteria bacterium]HOV92646.1 glycogen/starch synthase [Candidatus Kapabacteria bacterium]
MSSNPINVLYVTPESLPYIRIHSLGDISYSFVMAMREQGIDIRLMMPRYGTISERMHQIHFINRLTNIDIQMGRERIPASVKSSSMNTPRTKVQAYITNNEKYFSSHKGIYRDAKTLELYPDNPERYMYFDRSVVETCNLIEWVPDIVHVVDGESALVPAMFKLLYPDKFQKTKFLLTIHNFEEQVEADKLIYDKLCIPKKYKDNFIHKNKFNFLKAGIIYSDAITTSNKVYKEAILANPQLSNGLVEYIDGKEFLSIPIGIEPWSWDPTRDKLIAYKMEYDFEDFKYNNKIDLCNKFGIEFDPTIPVFGLILDVNEYEAIDYFIDNASEIFKNENLIVLTLARVEIKYKNTINLLQKKYKRNLRVLYTNDQSYFHQLFAGSDFFLSFDTHDPTNLNLMYAANYGAIPITHDNFIDRSIFKPYNPDTNEGFTMIFNKAHTQEFYNYILEAIKIFDDKETFNKIIDKTRSQKFSWDEGAKEYKALYTRLIKGK